MGNYYLDKDTYIIKDYDKLPPFSNFLPGIAGVKGIPLWVYYNNRGQGITSFGIHNKGNAIMEFNPANTAYENTSLKGYRTFVKCNGEYFEPFLTLDSKVSRNMYIKRNSLMVEEINERYGLKFRVKYFVLPNESIGAFVRKVEIINLDNNHKEIEIIDGLSKIIPYGIQNGVFKELSNLLKSWTEIKNIDENVPFYTMRSSSEDTAEVSEIEGGYYYLVVHKEKVLPVIYDPEVVFFYDTSLINPITFLYHHVSELIEKKQYYHNKIPCGFTPMYFTLSGGESFVFHSLTGFASSPEQINRKLSSICNGEYLLEKELCADEMVDKITGDVDTHTALPLFDEYIKQCYLDNFLRGGYPFVFNKDSNKSVVHLFSRKHGDPERDYNFFSIAGEYYSQGNGNFRDVNQNRRNDLFFNKDIGEFNIKTFFQLIQMDGFNPLEVRPSTFSIREENRNKAEKLIDDNIKSFKEPDVNNSSGIKDNDIISNRNRLKNIISKPFTPGQVANFIVKNQIHVSCGEDEFLEKLLSLCDQNIEAGFGEGYWSDHWVYNMDLIENYLKIYPDRIKELLFEDDTYRYYDSAARVLPRSEKYVINKKNEVRQYGSLVHDEEKAARDGFNKNGTNWLKNKKGEIVTSTLMAKMICLATNKFSSLDSYGMGIEMEAGRPGWNDAMNGLPGLFGSGMPETFELVRLVRFIRDTVLFTDAIKLPAELYDFLIKVSDALNKATYEGWSDFRYWDTVSAYREEYRELIRFGIDGSFREISANEVHSIFDRFNRKLELGIKKACEYGNGLVPTYFIFHAVKFEPVVDEINNPVISHYGLQKARVLEFKAEPLPYFLEAPAKMLMVTKDKELATDIYNKVKESELYDRKLNMYKTSVPLDALSMEVGRIRAFTPGWLERESVFLHMEYKYLLSLLVSGLYEEFYADIKTCMVAFRDPSQYGRSILENSSFIATSVNPDEKVHGRGYQARLSGSTTETISMWIHMFMGTRIFTYENNELRLYFEPNLPEWFFDKNDEVSFTFLSTCKVTYYNPNRKATFGVNGAKVKSIVIADTNQEITGNFISGELAEMVRGGKVSKIKINLE